MTLTVLKDHQEFRVDKLIAPTLRCLPFVAATARALFRVALSDFSFDGILTATCVSDS